MARAPALSPLFPSPSSPFCPGRGKEREKERNEREGEGEGRGGEGRRERRPRRFISLLLRVLPSTPTKREGRE